jgi:hypothetical protein
MTDYTTIKLDDLDEFQQDIVNAVINEGRMRQKEEVLAKIERKITEAYANNDRELVVFLEELIRDLDLDM